MNKIHKKITKKEKKINGFYNKNKKSLTVNIKIMNDKKNNQIYFN